MSRYDVLSSGYNPLDSYYEHDAKGEVVARPAIQPEVKKVLDAVRARERDMEKFMEWVNNRK